VGRGSAVSLLAAMLVGCSQTVLPSAAPIPAIPGDSVAASLFLIGDGGEPNPAGEPVLIALTAELSRAPDKSLVLFLGDNVYPRGIPDSTAPEYGEMRRHLTAQVEAVVSSGARGIFIPGNHDWAKSGADGWQAVLRAQAIVAATGGDRVIQLPANACPGPAVADIASVRLVLIDTEWWLHPGPRPDGAKDGCVAGEQGLSDSLRALLMAPAGRTTIVAGHHPVVSGGQHAGYFGWKDYFFPLLNVKPWLWVPLPIIGALYPAARNQGISRQDESNAHYGQLIDSLNAAFATAPPAAYVSGHDHGLQVIQSTAAPWQLVSGAGYYGHIDFVSPVKGSRVTLARSGFMRLDVSLDGRLRLGVLTVDKAGQATEVASIWLKPQ
jgi:hypothetical protein